VEVTPVSESSAVSHQQAKSQQQPARGIISSVNNSEVCLKQLFLCDVIFATFHADHFMLPEVVSCNLCLSLVQTLRISNYQVHLRLTSDGTKHRVYLSHLKNGRAILKHI
jgi:hypothetical protein